MVSLFSQLSSIQLGSIVLIIGHATVEKASCSIRFLSSHHSFKSFQLIQVRGVQHKLN